CVYETAVDLGPLHLGTPQPPGVAQSGASPRFEVVYHLYSLEYNRRVRLKVPVPGHDPMVESLTRLWPAANWFEREVWDMFGIRFLGHPDLKRLLMYEEFEGHPLRKDYPVNRRQPLIGPAN
ncbi:MAG: NADH-quinone oxidoreductase subunit C, partial [Candidatus Omnitrophica bacterium]|nr:NADH-quinone oxidoreductase subunit C [Candidatus Omnitrophota bacterium]